MCTCILHSNIHRYQDPKLDTLQMYTLIVTCIIMRMRMHAHVHVLVHTHWGSAKECIDT